VLAGIVFVLRTTATHAAGAITRPRWNRACRSSWEGTGDPGTRRGRGPGGRAAGEVVINIAGMETPTVWHNPRCSKSRGALALLAERGIEPALVRYLDQAPDRAALEDVLRKLGTDDPRVIIRTGEPRYRELDLAAADRDGLLDALVAEPALIERPIVVVGDRAVVARPPERLLELLDAE
jgi:arsenate reductase